MSHGDIFAHQYQFIALYIWPKKSHGIIRAFNSTYNHSLMIEHTAFLNDWTHTVYVFVLSRGNSARRAWVQIFILSALSVLLFAQLKDLSVWYDRIRSHYKV